MFHLLVLAAVTVASPWTGRYSLTSQLESTDCVSFQCPQGMTKVPAYVVEQGNLTRAWLYPHQGLQVSYDCTPSEDALLCSAHLPGEDFDITSTVTLSPKEGYVVGQAKEVYSTCIDTEITACTCNYQLQAHKTQK